MISFLSSILLLFLKIIIMKKYITILLLFTFISQLKAQQEPQYTQFMFNKLAFNAAYAGSANGVCATALYRNQWVGLDGAPVTQTLSFHTPIENTRIGIGLNVVHDKIGPTDSWNVGLNYAYRMPLETGIFSLGISGNLYRYQTRLENETLINSGDNLIQATKDSGFFPNIGLGAYYENDKYYVGLSVPYLAQSDISLLPANFTNGDVTSRRDIHAYIMGGVLFNVSDDLDIKPAALVKYAKNSPLDLDLNFSLIFRKKILAGLTYRLGAGADDGIGESIDLIVQCMLAQGINVGVAFDFTLSELANYNSGTFEIMMQYCGTKKTDGEAVQPRFF